MRRCTPPHCARPYSGVSRPSTHEREEPCPRMWGGGWTRVAQFTAWTTRRSTPRRSSCRKSSRRGTTMRA
eukprot:13053391-Alexandrium_andersonii.AAC.1